MQEVTFAEIKRSSEYFEALRFLESDGAPEIRTALHNPRWLNGHGVRRYAEAPAAVMAALGTLEGACVLDLGCGSKSEDVFENEKYWGRRKFEPYTARILHALGVHVIGVDAAPSEESYDHRLADLALEPIPVLPGEADLAFSHMLYDSPALSVRFRHTDPDFCATLHNKLSGELETLMPGGTYLHDLPEAQARELQDRSDPYSYHLSQCDVCEPASLRQRLRG